MKTLFRHIFCVAILLFVTFLAAGQERNMDERLDMYEDLCGQCMKLKSKVAAGEQVSREEAQSLIDSFLGMNKGLKAQEPEMSEAQRRRFTSIGEWFTTGVRPEAVAGTIEVNEPLADSDYLAVTDSSRSMISTGTDIRPDVTEVSKRGDVFLLASLAVPDMSYGLMTGYQHGRWGGYLAFRSNFTSCDTSYSCASDGSLENGSQIWSNGTEKRSNLMVSGGVLARAEKWLTVYAGAGYGYRKLAWEDVDGNWASVSDWSRSGFAAECGVIASWRLIAVSAGISTISFRTASLTCGVGIRF
ncbi:MAG: hypothetical protein IKW11_07685 [Bacteroidales bacterium]|nr:hypothetical protein [Bacteroidales bacterium]